MHNRNCPSCNHEVSNKQNFCPNCGTPLTKKAEEKAAKKPNSGSKSLNRDAFIIIGAIVVIVAGYFILNQPSNNSPQQTQQNQAQQGQMLEGHEGFDMGQVENLPTDYNGLVQAGHVASLDTRSNERRCQGRTRSNRAHWLRLAHSS